MNTIPVITACNIDPMPRSLFSDMPFVNVTFDDGRSIKLFQFYPDEISFSSQEFIGLTKQEAHNLKFKKDKKYLQS